MTSTHTVEIKAGTPARASEVADALKKKGYQDAPDAEQRVEVVGGNVVKVTASGPTEKEAKIKALMDTN